MTPDHIPAAEVRERVSVAVDALGARGPFTTYHVANVIENQGGPRIRHGQVAYVVGRHPRVLKDPDQSGYYILGPEIPEGHAVLGIYPCGCVNYADSQPTARSIQKAQRGDCRAEIVPLAEARERFKKTWGRCTHGRAAR